MKGAREEWAESTEGNGGGRELSVPGPERGVCLFPKDEGERNPCFEIRSVPILATSRRDSRESEAKMIGDSVLVISQACGRLPSLRRW